MRFVEFAVLNEAVGSPFTRTPGDPPFVATPDNKFGAQAGDVYQFVDIDIFPKKGLFYRDQNAMHQELNMVKSQIKEPINWTNSVLGTGFSKKSLSFAVAKFTGPSGKSIYFGRHLHKIEDNMSTQWTDKELPGLTPAPKVKPLRPEKIRGTEKPRSSFRPQKIFDGPVGFPNREALMNALTASDRIDDNIKYGLLMIGDKKNPIFENSAQFQSSIVNDLGEVIQPLMLTYGMIGGEANRARNEVLNGAPWEKLAIEFPAENYGLVDSVLVSGGRRLRISSKGTQQGASASIKNLYEPLKENLEFRKNLQEKYPTEFHIIETLGKANPAREGVIELAQEYGILSGKKEEVSQHAEEIRAELVRKRGEGNKDMPTQPRSRNEVLAMVKSLKDPPLSQWAQDQLASYITRLPLGWTYGAWLFSAVSKKLVNYINSLPNFSNVCLEILNNASMMELETNSQQQEKNLAILGFIIKYPKTFTGKVTVDQKMTDVTTTGGRLTFYLDSGKNPFNII
jgi:hypothetical protein